MKESELFELKEEIEEKKQHLSELKGELKVLLKQFEEYGCKTIRDVEKAISTKEKELDSISNEIELRTNALEEMLDEDE